MHQVSCELHRSALVSVRTRVRARLLADLVFDPPLSRAKLVQWQLHLPLRAPVAALAAGPKDTATQLKLGYDLGLRPASKKQNTLHALKL